MWPADRKALAPVYSRNEDAVGSPKGLSSKQCGVRYRSSGGVVSIGSSWVLHNSVGSCKHVGGWGALGAAKGAEENATSSSQTSFHLFCVGFVF